MTKVAQKRRTGGLGGRLRRYRLGRNLTQTELSGKAEVSVDTLNKAENGLRQPHPQTIRKLAEALGVEVEALTGGVGR